MLDKRITLDDGTVCFIFEKMMELTIAFVYCEHFFMKNYRSVTMNISLIVYF